MSPSPKGSPARLKSRAKWMAKRRKERIQAGLCVRCGGPRDHPGKQCRSCLDKRRAYYLRTSDPTRTQPPGRCAKCGSTGHRKDTCPVGVQRPETGPMQFGDDWPGLFIRGDNAMFFAAALGGALAGQWEGLHRSVLEGLLSALRSCNVRNDPKPQLAVLLPPG